MSYAPLTVSLWCCRRGGGVPAGGVEATSEGSIHREGTVHPAASQVRRASVKLLRGITPLQMIGL